jgi:hypothetical protein
MVGVLVVGVSGASQQLSAGGDREVCKRGGEAQRFGAELRGSLLMLRSTTHIEACFTPFCHPSV